MNDALEQGLFQDFPQIFRDWGGDPIETCMAWGIAVGDGWHDLIRKLCVDIMALNPPEEFKAEQVKEKFGELRFYVSGGTVEILDLVDKAENDSGDICESCGSLDDVTSSGSWVKTLCDTCRTGKTPKLDSPKPKSI